MAGRCQPRPTMTFTLESNAVAGQQFAGNGNGMGIKRESSNEVTV